jgi:hypothetical protein
MAGGRPLGYRTRRRSSSTPERTKTRFNHQWDIRRVYGLREFADVEGAVADI